MNTPNAESARGWRRVGGGYQRRVGGWWVRVWRTHKPYPTLFARRHDADGRYKRWSARWVMVAAWRADPRTHIDGYASGDAS